MANFTLEEVCRATGGTKLGQVNLTEFTGVYTDSRKVVPGSLFVALKGENFDGHAFIADVIAKGAAAVIVDRPVASTVTTILCANTLKALQDLAAFHRRRFAIPVIAITGSNGKTTTKDMLAAILAEKWNVVKTPGNYNNEIGLPLTLLALTSETQVAVVEMGMRGRGQIAELAAIAAPTAAIVTTVGETHIELLGSLENIAAAKAELVEAIAADGFVVLNNDNPYVAAMDSVAKAPVATFGLAETASVRAQNVVMSRDKITFDCTTAAETFAVVVPALGEHNVLNALAAITAAQKLGLTSDAIIQGMLHFSPSGMRLAMEAAGPYQVINDAYNASPASMKSALETLKTIHSGRRVAVLADMLELGEQSVMLHRQVGAVAAKTVDLLVTLGALGAEIASGAKEAGLTAVYTCKDHGEVVAVLRSKLTPEDLILVKGSRGMKMEQIIASLRDTSSQN